MRNALLLYNPESGRRRGRRVADVDAALLTLRAAGVEAAAEATRAPGSAAEQARAAIQRGCDAVIVCGGDGSVHEALPGIAGTNAALGVIPLGTANGLANDLGLPGNITRAAQMLASAEVRPVALPRIEYQGPDGRIQSRHWIMGAGIGADAFMVYRLTLTLKQRWGNAAYYGEATRQWLTHDFPMFFAEFEDDDGKKRREQVSQVLAIRIANFGGMLRKLAPGAALERPDFQLVLFKTRSRASFLRYVMGAWTGRLRSRKDVEIVPARECRCLAAEPGARIFSEADGELLGTLPVTVAMSQDTVNLLAPRTAARKSAVL